MTDWIYDSISAAGVAVGGIFSFLVWKATKNSADIAKRSFEMARQMKEKEDLTWSSTQLFWRKQVLRDIHEVDNALVSQAGNQPNSWPIMHAPQNTKVEFNDLMTYFTEDERQTIAFIWIKFEEYMQENWITSVGMKHAFTDEEKEQIRRASLALSQCIRTQIHALEQKWDPANHEKTLSTSAPTVMQQV